MPALPASATKAVRRGRWSERASDRLLRRWGRPGVWQGGGSWGNRGFSRVRKRRRCRLCRRRPQRLSGEDAGVRERATGSSGVGADQAFGREGARGGTGGSPAFVNAADAGFAGVGHKGCPERTLE